MPTRNEVRSVLLGAAVGDAFGVPFEFLGAEKIKNLPMDRMLGANVEPIVGSHWGSTIPAGAWSDDTSMAVAALESIVKLGRIDHSDIMDQFVAWWERNEYCAVDKAFGLGKTVARALGAYLAGKPAPCRRQDNGNGALMRIFPFTAYSMELGEEERIRLIREASTLTHGHEISQLSCIFFSEFLRRMLLGDSFEAALGTVRTYPWSEHFGAEALDAHSRILQGDLNGEMQPTGYVVDTLEIALQCLLHTDTYKTAVQKAVSFGGDTDTYAAIVGAAAGAFYTVEGIPEEWLSVLKRREYLEELADRFADLIVG